jgi:hypothetical protein
VTDPCYYVGLDPGQPHEYSALAVLARPAVNDRTPVGYRRPPYAVPHLLRLPPGTPYRDGRAALAAALDRLADGPVVVLVDETGVGEPVARWLATAAEGRPGCRVVPVVLSAGPVPGVYEDRAVLPRTALVGALQLLLQAGRLRVADALPEAATLVAELTAFRARPVLAGADGPTAWREGLRDDLVLAVALAAWAGETALGGVPEDGPAWPTWWEF